MAHHKRKRPKHQRAGCLFCKPWKDERGGGRYGDPNTAGERRRLLSSVDEGLAEMEADRG